MSLMNELVRNVERWRALDTVGRPVAAAVGKVVRPAPVRNLLSGTLLGHPLHPVLTDVPIGAWFMAGLVDLVGGREAEPVADLLVATGIAAAVPTAAAGLNDWSDTRGRQNRVGLAHAVANSTALALYTASWLARRRGRRLGGKVLALAGLGSLTTGAYLGGHLSYAQGVNVNRTAWRSGPREWTAVLDEAELVPGTPRRVEAGDVSVLLARVGGAVTAVDSVCSHLGGPLEQGTIVDGCVTCPWHGSTFRLADGAVVRGPASSPQPAYDVRVREGRIELRARPW
ncbi:Rieske (2Fe-2S) protein [Citricoccus sp. SGAir0253]|uniref:Rieske 2Fe-2S domain-containing protein n=1 Tax=Citricoccus sp. SGAir0253 TaxID=2567881 RepID=UPI0010CD1761|nr:Rieske (2Fe-2S) protein [Citricoccus sp. SGAir0253]QCU77169.1 Rieske (2Fe-2S) protein [Citricoccus sp. SGAir0253]